MRIAILSPCSTDANRGNSTTAQRLRTGLERSHHQVEQLNSQNALNGSDIKCDLIIALHAEKSGPCAREIANEKKIPLVILFTGTDLNGKPSAQAIRAVDAADAMVTLGNSAARRVRSLFADVNEKLSVIKQAVLPLPEKRGAAIPKVLTELSDDTELIFLPTGIRAIKDPLRAVHALAPLSSSRSKLKLFIAGEVMEKDVAQELEIAVREREFVKFLGVIPREQMAAYMRRANVVISTSKSEGGPPNALLEAGLMARPILASDIPAHREFPGGGRLFKDDRGLRRKLAQILDNPRDAQIAAISMREDVRQGFAAAREAAAWTALVHKL